MSYRQIIQLEGDSVENPNLSSLSIDSDLLNVAQLPSIAYWPALETWGVADNGYQFKDMLTDDLHYVGDENTSITLSDYVISSEVDGNSIYNIVGNVNKLIVDDFDSSGSFTIAGVFGKNVGFGSINSDSGLWWLRTSGSGDTDGMIRYSVAGVTTDYEDYTGTLIEDDTLTPVIFTLDRDRGEVYLIVDGVKQLVNSIDSDVSVLSELQVGVINPGADAVIAQYMRGFMVFNKAITGSSLTKLQAYLDSIS